MSKCEDGPMVSWLNVARIQKFTKSEYKQIQKLRWKKEPKNGEMKNIKKFKISYANN